MSKSAKTTKIPDFASEDDERAFSAQADSADYVNWSQARAVTLPDLRPTLRTIPLRLPVALIAEIKQLANKRDVPYQSLLKMF